MGGYKVTACETEACDVPPGVDMYPVNDGAFVYMSVGGYFLFSLRHHIVHS